MFDKEKDFWDKKIIQWENGRYLNKNDFLLEKVSDYFSNSLKFRRKKSLDFLKKIDIRNKIVYEQGCGSGFLAKEIIEMGAKKYIGLDISNKAIDRANNLNQKLIKNNKCEFICNRPEACEHINYDIVFSLGFIDWLNDEDLKKLINKKNLYKSFFHSYSSLNKYSISQLVHRLYVYFSYKRKKKLSPIYRSDQYIINLFKADFKINIYSHSKLSFGKFFGNIEFE